MNAAMNNESNRKKGSVFSGLSEPCLGILEHGWRGLVEIARDGRILRTNRAFTRMLGHADGLPSPLSLEALCLDPDQCRALMELLQAQGSVSRFELLVRHATDTPLTLILDAMRAGAPATPTDTFLAIVETIHDGQTQGAPCLKQELRDNVTGLPSWELFQDRLEQVLERTKRRPRDRFALAFVAISNLQEIRDQFGEHCITHLLGVIGKRLENALRVVDTVACFNDHQFIILLNDVDSENVTLNAMDRVFKMISGPVLFSGHGASCDMNIGVLLSNGYANAQEMLREMNRAVEQHRHRENGRVFLIQGAPSSRPHLRDIHPDEIGRGLKFGQFQLFYQPVFQLKNLEIIGFQAFPRWQHPSLGLLHQSAILSAMTDSELIHSFAYWMLGTACAQMQLWQRQHRTNPSLTITLHFTEIQFAYPKLADNIKAALEATDLAEHSLKIEFSLDAMNRVENIGDLLMRLRDLDVQLAINDSGMGSSHLLQMKQFSYVPVDNLKINRSIIRRMADHNASMETVWTTILLAHSLGIEVTGDGVETREQLDTLTDMRCDYAQGSYFSRPLDSAHAGELLRCCLLPKNLEQQFSNEGHGAAMGFAALAARPKHSAS